MTSYPLSHRHDRGTVEHPHAPVTMTSYSLYHRHDRFQDMQRNICIGDRFFPSGSMVNLPPISVPLQLIDLIRAVALGQLVEVHLYVPKPLPPPPRLRLLLPQLVPSTIHLFTKIGKLLHD